MGQGQWSRPSQEEMEEMPGQLAGETVERVNSGCRQQFQQLSEEIVFDLLPFFLTLHFWSTLSSIGIETHLIHSHLQQNEINTEPPCFQPDVLPESQIILWKQAMCLLALFP